MLTGSVYKIWSPSSDDIYIGSTTQALSSRMSSHRAGYKSWLQEKTKYTSSFAIIALGDASIELIETVQFKTKNELRAREGHHIRINPCLNRCIAGRSRVQYNTDNAQKIKEQKHQYHVDNRDDELTRMRKYKAAHIEDIQKYTAEHREDKNNKRRAYYNDNQEKVAAEKAVRCNCPCGVSHSNGNAAAHRKTKKHQSYLTQEAI
jgi:hypothetical protein